MPYLLSYNLRDFSNRKKQGGSFASSVSLLHIPVWVWCGPFLWTLNIVLLHVEPSISFWCVGLIFKHEHWQINIHFGSRDSRKHFTVRNHRQVRYWRTGRDAVSRWSFFHPLCLFPCPVGTWQEILVLVLFPCLLNYLDANTGFWKYCVLWETCSSPRQHWQGNRVSP